MPPTDKFVILTPANGGVHLNGEDTRDAVLKITADVLPALLQDDLDRWLRSAQLGERWVYGDACVVICTCVGDIPRSGDVIFLADDTGREFVHNPTRWEFAGNYWAVRTREGYNRSIERSMERDQRLPAADRHRKTWAEIVLQAS